MAKTDKKPIKAKPISAPLFRQWVRQTLQDVWLWQEPAEELLMGTCAQESLFGTYRHQIGGPAHGVMQVELATFTWLRDKYKNHYPELKSYNFEDLIDNDRASILVARLKYLTINEPIPDTLVGQAAYWNRYYNCNPRYGTDEEYIRHYRKYVIDGKGA